MKRKYSVNLSKEERLQVYKTVDCNTTPKTVRRRCNVLLLADIGYPNTNYFSNQFKKLTGLYPTEYRKTREP